MTKYAATFGLRLPMSAINRQRTVYRTNRRWFLIPLVAMMVFGVGYIFTVNRTSSQGYELREVEKRISQLKSETKKLELTVAGLQSMGSIGSRVASMEFVPVTHVEYLKAGAPAVALR